MSFGFYFRENMQALNLPAPDSLFVNLTQVAGSIAGIQAFIEKFGTRVTVREMIRAGLLSERYATIGALSASFYLGAVVGSAAVAVFRVANKGATLADVIEQGVAMGARNRAALYRVFTENPQLYQRLATRTSPAQRPLAH